MAVLPPLRPLSLRSPRGVTERGCGLVTYGGMTRERTDCNKEIIVPTPTSRRTRCNAFSTELRIKGSLGTVIMRVFAPIGDMAPIGVIAPGAIAPVMNKPIRAFGPIHQEYCG